MATEKVTIMVLKVDLQCPACYKKTKKTLCKFPQIRDQIYDEKANTVTITVVCCCPEKIQDKLCCKGGKAIKSITIKEPAKPKDAAADKPKEPEKPKEPADKPKGPEKPKEPADKPKGPAKPKVVIVDPKDAGKPKSNEKTDKPKPQGVPPAEKPKPKPKPDGVPQVEKPADKPKEAAKPEPAKHTEPIMIPFPVEPMKGPVPGPVQGVPSVFPYVGPSYDPYSAGPYYHGPGYPQTVYYEGYYNYGQVEGYGLGHGPGRVANWNRSESYFTEENPQVCSIM